MCVLGEFHCHRDVHTDEQRAYQKNTKNRRQKKKKVKRLELKGARAPSRHYSDTCNCNLFSVSQTSLDSERITRTRFVAAGK